MGYPNEYSRHNEGSLASARCFAGDPLLIGPSLLPFA
jgi:hypothetical protein